MSLINISDMIERSLDNLTALAKDNVVFGDAILVADNTSVIPLTKITIGFVSGGAEIKRKENRLEGSETPIGSLGGGITMTPTGFLVVKDGHSTILKTNGDNGAEKWMDIISEVIRNLSEKE